VELYCELIGLQCEITRTVFSLSVRHGAAAPRRKMMTEIVRAPEARLTCHLRSAALVGTAGGKPIHSLIEMGSWIAPGRYRISSPATHPVLGRVAILSNALAGGQTIGGLPPVGNALTGTVTISPAAGNVLAGGLSGLLLRAVHGGKFPGSNGIVVLSGYEELMGGLESSGGGILEVVA
jgi:hypothetical protein